MLSALHLCSALETKCNLHFFARDNECEFATPIGEVFSRSSRIE